MRVIRSCVTSSSTGTSPAVTHKTTGAPLGYFEVADDGYVERQVEQYGNGACLTYDRRHIEDKFGGLAEKPLEVEEWKELHPFSAAEFEAVWSSARPLNRKSG
jgi:hypothetical protein